MSETVILKQVQAPPAIQAPEPQRNLERLGLDPAFGPAMGPGVDGASAPNSTATCSITLDSPPTATVTCEPVLLKVSICFSSVRNFRAEAVNLVPTNAWSFSYVAE